jgi:opacity protein-like surface antigen
MRATLLIAGFLVTATFASADLAPGSQTLSLQGGGADFDPDGGINSDSDRGYSFGAQYMYYFTEQPMFGIGLDAQQFRVRDERNLWQHGAGNVGRRHESTTRRSYQLMGKLIFPKGPVRPYIFAGLGAYTYDDYIGGTRHRESPWSDTSTTETRALVNRSGTDFTGSYGVGLDWYITERLFLGAEYRYSFFSQKNQTVTAEGSRQYVSGSAPDRIDSALLRIGVRFGR